MSLRLVGVARRRSMSLTPMIDVVFLLLVFFMLASRFETNGAVEISVAGAGEAGSAPRLIDVFNDGVALNGVSLAEEELAQAAVRLLDDASSVVVLRPRGEASVQRLIDIAEALRGAGVANLAIVE